MAHALRLSELIVDVSSELAAIEFDEKLYV
jgi:hypothetical protein